MGRNGHFRTSPDMGCGSIPPVVWRGDPPCWVQRTAMARAMRPPTLEKTISDCLLRLPLGHGCRMVQAPVETRGTRHALTHLMPTCPRRPVLSQAFRDRATRPQPLQGQCRVLCVHGVEEPCRAPMGACAMPYERRWAEGSCTDMARELRG
jgi:hypothetical protein